MANIDDPKHAHYLEPLKAGQAFDPKHASFIKGAKLTAEGHLSFTVGADPVRLSENADGSVTDRITLDRTYKP